MWIITTDMWNTCISCVMFHIFFTCSTWEFIFDRIYDFTHALFPRASTQGSFITCAFTRTSFVTWFLYIFHLSSHGILHNCSRDFNFTSQVILHTHLLHTLCLSCDFTQTSFVFTCDFTQFISFSRDSWLHTFHLSSHSFLHSSSSRVILHSFFIQFIFTCDLAHALFISACDFTRFREN